MFSDSRNQIQSAFKYISVTVPPTNLNDHLLGTNFLVFHNLVRYDPGSVSWTWSRIHYVWTKICRWERGAGVSAMIVFLGIRALFYLFIYLQKISVEYWIQVRMKWCFPHI